MFNFFRKKQTTFIVDQKAVLSPAQISLSHQIRDSLPEGMVIPPALNKLFLWIESEGFTWQRGETVGGALMQYGTTKRALSPYIEFSAEGAKNLKYWFGHDSPELHNRLYVFSKTGAEGSMGAFWLDDEGIQHIVHMGSGSGSIMTCILTDNAVDFLRLLAIGYDEICWGEFSTPPGDETPLNMKFRTWVETEFSVSIPSQGDEIVAETAEMTDSESSSDPFLKWVTAMVAQEEQS